MINSNDFIKYLAAGAMGGFERSFPLLSVCSYVVAPRGLGLNSVVQVPFISSSAVNAFSYSTGYSTNNSYAVAKPVTLSKIAYSKWSLTDSDALHLSQDAVVQLGTNLGDRLAGDVYSDMLSIVTAGSGFASASYVSSEFTSSVAANDLMLSASLLNFPEQGRSLLMSPTYKSYALKDNNVINNSIFSGNVARSGNIGQYYSFDTYNAASITTLVDGFACNRNAIIFANGVHVPQEGNVVNWNEVSSERTGITIGVREIAEGLKATKHFVLDVLYGYAVGDPNAGIMVLKG